MLSNGMATILEPAVTGEIQRGKWGNKGLDPRHQLGKLML
jgi:hypothetical protein